MRSNLVTPDIVILNIEPERDVTRHRQRSCRGATVNEGVEYRKVLDQELMCKSGDKHTYLDTLNFMQISGNNIMYKIEEIN